MTPYTKGIPTEPGLYWYSDTSTGDDPAICTIVCGGVEPRPEHITLTVHGCELGTRDFSKGFFCHAIPPEVNDE